MGASFRKAFGLMAAVFCGFVGAAQAAECTLVLDAATNTIVLEEGECRQRYTPASTFKIPLSLIAYDAGILTDAHAPRWNWKPGMRAPKRDQKAVDPTIWQADSVLWYSREITRHLEAERFADYVRQLGYGNGDVSGDPGVDNGLTQAWLTSSLQISPYEQAAFLKKLLTGDLAVSAAAQRQTMSIIPTFKTSNGWTAHGKTGSGWTRDTAGEIRKDRPVGWFVGWAEKNGRTVVFARQGIGQTDGRQGLVEQRNLLEALEAL